MKIIQGVQLEDEEIQSILFCLKWAQKRDAQESIFSEERRRVVSRLIREFARLTGAPVEWEPWTNVKKKLTSREFEILREIIHGLSNKEISNKFKISNNTVKAHLKNIYKKLGVRNRWELITQFYRED